MSNYQNSYREVPNNLSLPDLLSGISVALLLVPQSMAYAELAGLPPYIGLFASALPPIFAAFAASSPYLQTGPVALTSLLTLGALNGLAELGSNTYMALAALLAVIVGVARILFGLFRMGKLVYLMDDPVLTGFTSAAAILIITSQLPKAFGIEKSEGNILRQAWEVFNKFDKWEMQSIILTISTIFLVLIGKNIHRLFPGALLVLVGSIAYSNLSDYSGPVVGKVPTGIPEFTFDFPWNSTGQLLLPGLVIALVGFAEPASISRIFAAEENHSWNANREFLSQGLANLAAGFSGAFPVGGSFSRSSLNKLSGAQSRWSGLITGAVVFAFLPLGNVLNNLPRATLAGVVIAAVIGLLQPKKLLDLFKTSTMKGLVALGTFVSTILFSPHIERGVLIGIVLSLTLRCWNKLKTI